MKMEFLKTLWTLRFEKIRDTEDDAAWRYQKLMDQVSLLLGAQHATVKVLKRLVQEELHHGQIARELVEICKKNHPDIEVTDH